MGSKVQLSRRLLAIGEMVTKGNRLVDVGCDHGYLPVYLVMNHRIPGAVAADVGRGPLERAREHIRKYHMEDYIETRLCDGLSGIHPGEGDTLVIAGMGGPLMERILSDTPAVRDSFQELILQPQSDVPHFRRFLIENGYCITEEKMILEEGKFYPMMKAVRSLDKKESWTSQELMFGKYLLQEKNPVLYQYLQREYRIRENILSRLGKAETEEAKKRQKEVEEEKQLILAALHIYES